MGEIKDGAPDILLVQQFIDDIDVLVLDEEDQLILEADAKFIIGYSQIDLNL